MGWGLAQSAGLETGSSGCGAYLQPGDDGTSGKWGGKVVDYLRMGIMFASEITINIGRPFQMMASVGIGK